MPMGIDVDEFPKMELGTLRQLLEIAEAMVTKTTMESFKSEYEAVAGLAKAEIRRREMVAAATTIRTALGLLWCARAQWRHRTPTSRAGDC